MKNLTIASKLIGFPLLFAIASSLSADCCANDTGTGKKNTLTANSPAARQVRQSPSKRVAVISPRGAEKQQRYGRTLIGVSGPRGRIQIFRFGIAWLVAVFPAS